MREFKELVHRSVVMDLFGCHIVEVPAPNLTERLNAIVGLFDRHLTEVAQVLNHATEQIAVHEQWRIKSKVDRAARRIHEKELILWRPWFQRCYWYYSGSPKEMHRLNQLQHRGYAPF